MSKQLTQAVFKDAPDWVRSAAVDESGIANLFACPISELEIIETPWGLFEFMPIEPKTKFEMLSNGYDTTNWRESAIDREEPARPREYIKDTI